MIVYIELIAINNFLINSFLIYFALTIAKQPKRLLRICLASIVGAVSSIMYIFALPEFKIAIAIVLAPLMTLIFAKTKGFVAFVKNLTLFCLTTAVFAGFLFMLSNIFGFNLSENYIFAIVLSCAMLFLVGVEIFKRLRGRDSASFDSAVLTIGDAKIEASAMRDTGNTLTDILTGKPIVILSSKIADRLTISENSYEGYVDIATVTGNQSLPIVKIDKFRIGQNEFDVFGALSNSDFNSCDIILQNTMF